MNRRLLIDLDALVGNYRLFQQAAVDPAAEVGAVVKADGYGMGAAPVARALEGAGARSFFVAAVEEGLALRAELGRSAKIYVFEGPDAANAGDLAAAGLIPMINDPTQLDWWKPYGSAPIAVHVDTGISRLGFPPDVSADLFAGFQIDLLLTHLACADQPEHPSNQQQLDRFAACIRRFPGQRTSVGNSAGWLSGGDRQGQLGRPGIGLYGGNPFSGRDNPCLAVGSLQGRVMQIKRLPAGEHVGYGATVRLERAATVAVVALGYADGVSRLLSGRGEMAVGGSRCKILGRVSMDMTVVDVSHVRGLAVGDWVESFGAVVSVDEVATWADTIAYEILTGVGQRVERIYHRSGQPA
jgi:alanine racemase